MYNERISPLVTEYQTLMEQGKLERQRYGDMLRSVESPYKDHYLTLEESYVGLTEQDMMTLLNDENFSMLNRQLNGFVESEMMKVIRVNLNKNVEAVKVMNNMVDIVNSYKKRKTDENERIMDEMKDYMANFSDLTFTQYKELKKK